MVDNLRHFSFLSPISYSFFIYLNFRWESLLRIHMVWNLDVFAPQTQECSSKSPVLGKQLNWFELS